MIAVLNVLAHVHVSYLLCVCTLCLPSLDYVIQYYKSFTLGLSDSINITIYRDSRSLSISRNLSPLLSRVFDAFFGGYGLDVKPYLMQTLRLALKSSKD